MPAVTPTSAQIIRLASRFPKASSERRAFVRVALQAVLPKATGRLISKKFQDQANLYVQTFISLRLEEAGISEESDDAQEFMVRMRREVYDREWVDNKASELDMQAWLRGTYSPSWYDGYPFPKYVEDFINPRSGKNEAAILAAAEKVHEVYTRLTAVQKTIIAALMGYKTPSNMEAALSEEGYKAATGTLEKFEYLLDLCEWATKISDPPRRK